MNAVYIQTREVARMRTLEQDANRLIENAKLDLQKTEAWKIYQDALDTRTNLLEKVDAAEEKLRAIALEEFRATGMKDLASVKIKMFTVREYDEAAALDHCIAHGQVNLLKLDKAAFNKYADATRPDFVEFREEPRAQIASDLSTYVPAEPKSFDGDDSDE